MRVEQNTAQNKLFFWLPFPSLHPHMHTFFVLCISTYWSHHRIYTNWPLKWAHISCCNLSPHSIYQNYIWIFALFLDVLDHTVAKEKHFLCTKIDSKNVGCPLHTDKETPNLGSICSKIRGSSVVTYKTKPKKYNINLIRNKFWLFSLVSYIVKINFNWETQEIILREQFNEFYDFFVL